MQQPVAVIRRFAREFGGEGLQGTFESERLPEAGGEVKGVTNLVVVVAFFTRSVQA